MKTVILSMLIFILIVVSFISGLLVGCYYTTVPLMTAMGNAFNTSYYQDGEVLVLLKDTKGIVFRKFSSNGELSDFIDGLKAEGK